MAESSTTRTVWPPCTGRSPAGSACDQWEEFITAPGHRGQGRLAGVIVADGAQASRGCNVLLGAARLPRADCPGRGGPFCLVQQAAPRKGDGGSWPPLLKALQSPKPIVFRKGGPHVMFVVRQKLVPAVLTVALLVLVVQPVLAD